MKAVILAGGAGTRLQALILDRPKPMAPIDGKPFLEYLIEWLKENDISEIILCLYYKPEAVRNYFKSGKKWGVKIRYVIEKSPLGTAGAVKNTQKIIGQETFLVVNGDTYFPVDIGQVQNFHQKKGGLGALVLGQVNDVSQYGSIIINKRNQILAFQEKLENQHTPGLASGGIYLFEPTIFDYLKRGKKISIENEIFPALVKNKKSKLYGFVTEKNFFDIGTPSGYRKTVAFLKKASPVIIRSRAPVRIAFGGGGTDIAPYTDKKGGCVLNATINKYVYGTLQLRDDRKIKILSADYKKSSLYDDISQLKEDRDIDLIKAIIKRMDINYGFELFVRSDVPPNTGLGSSASVAVAVIGLFNYFRKNNFLNLHEIAELAFSVEEQDCKNITGRQDQYAAVYGGFNFFEFKGKDFVKVSPLELPKNYLYELEKNLLLVYVGKRRESGEMSEFLRKQQRTYKELKKQSYLDSIKDLAYQSYYSLIEGNLDHFGELLGLAWEVKKKLNPQVTNKEIEKLYHLALRNGALGGRITGAGGGGHMIIYCQPNREQEVARALQKKGAEIIDFSFTGQGLQLWEVQDAET